MPLTSVDVTGTYVDPLGVPVEGQVDLLASAEMLNGGQVVSRHVINGPLTDGLLDLEVEATTNADTIPAGVTYLVTERIIGAPPVSFSTSVSADARDGVFDLSCVEL